MSFYALWQVGSGNSRVTVPGPNQEQEEFWSTEGGVSWSHNDALLDTTLGPVLDHLLDVTALGDGEQVLDIGCGTGQSTIRAAWAVGQNGTAMGLDIAEQMLERARAQAAADGIGNLEFVQADAQVQRFEPDAFDAVISRFGVMFFADPAAAFANIARALRPGGRMVFMTWASMIQNPWFSVPRTAAMERLGPIDPTPPHAPGPMGLADRDYTLDVFRRAGLANVTVTPVALDLTPPGTARDMGEFAMTLGPAVRIMAEKEGGPEDKAAIIEAVATRLAEFETQAGLRIPAMLNRIEVRLP